MLVYRLENAEGDGPFVTAEIYNHMPQDAHINVRKYPNTYNAFSEYDYYRAECKPHGCRSLRELLYWFPAKVIRQMRGEGFGVAVYEVPDQDVIFGKFQLVFYPTNATRKVFK